MCVYERINQNIWPITCKGLSRLLFQVYSLLVWELYWLLRLQQHFWCKDMKAEGGGGRHALSPVIGIGGGFWSEIAGPARALMCDTAVQRPAGFLVVGDTAAFTRWCNFTSQKKRCRQSSGGGEHECISQCSFSATVGSYSTEDKPFDRKIRSKFTGVLKADFTSIYVVGGFRVWHRRHASAKSLLCMWE